MASPLTIDELHGKARALLVEAERLGGGDDRTRFVLTLTLPEVRALEAVTDANRRPTWFDNVLSVRLASLSDKVDKIETEELDKRRRLHARVEFLTNWHERRGRQLRVFAKLLNEARYNALWLSLEKERLELALQDTEELKDALRALRAERISLLASVKQAQEALAGVGPTPQA